MEVLGVRRGGGGPGRKRQPIMMILYIISENLEFSKILWLFCLWLCINMTRSSCRNFFLRTAGCICGCLDALSSSKPFILPATLISHGCHRPPPSPNSYPPNPTSQNRTTLWPITALVTWVGNKVIKVSKGDNHASGSPIPQNMSDVCSGFLR